MKIAIAGGGLVGAICACILGQKGHNVVLYEMREDPKEGGSKIVRGRSINLALSTRGRLTLRKAGLEEKVLKEAIPMKGRMLHLKDGTKKEVIYDPNGKECIYSVSRRFLNDFLLEEAEKIGNVEVKYGHKLLNADFDTGVVNLSVNGPSSSQVETKVDLIIGADGAHSAMRKSLLKRFMVNFSQKYIEHGYIELCIPAKENGDHAMEMNYLHIWPRSRFMLIGLPNKDGSFTSTLFMPFEMFNNLMTADKIEQFFKSEFPDAFDLIGKEVLIQDFMAMKPSNLISIKCNPLSGGKGVMIGDAAHAMVPFYGQGMNAGFEDVLLLTTLLDGIEAEDVEDFLRTFTAKRWEDAEAICELAMYNYLEMRHLVNQKSFYVRRIIDLGLYKLFGNSWVPIYNAVTFSTKKYSDCIRHRKWQDEKIDLAVSGIKISLVVGTIGGLLYWRNSIHHLFEAKILPNILQFTSL